MQWKDGQQVKRMEPRQSSRELLLGEFGVYFTFDRHRLFRRRLAVTNVVCADLPLNAEHRYSRVQLPSAKGTFF